ncbi:hypothetical protein PG993_015186 [Apiospora rasikravindrae]|uniref:Fucose-specific lectin n=1 Tax=Apiospora rasikravindrae TaxID=990691 RepID=A0ABR1RQ26_9PEZI
MEVSPVDTTPVRPPQHEYWDEKICVEPEDINNNNAAAGPSTTSEKSAAVAAMGGYQPQGLRRAGTGATELSEPAPAYMRRDLASQQQQQQQGSSQQSTFLYKDEPGYAKGDVPMPAVDRQIFGLSKKTFILAVSGLALFLVILLAVILGITLGRSGDSGKGSGGTGILGLLENSKLSAMNWTDPMSGVDHSAVFYQHKSNALMMSVRDSTSQQWRSINVTASVMNTTKAIGLNVLPGTPLACVTNAFQQSCYYLNGDRRVAEIYNTDPTFNGWQAGVFGSKIQARTAPDSRISAVWQVCQNCSNSILVAWQDANGADVKIGNFTAGDWAQGPTLFESAAPGAGLAMSVFNDFRGTGPFGTDPNALRLYTASGANLVELLNGPETNFNWGIGNFANPVTSGLSLNPSPDIASITYGNNGWDNNLVTFLGPKGKLMSAVYRGAGWSVQAATLSGAPASALDGFASIAATQSMRLYAISQRGDIHEFTTNSTNPFLLTWAGVVNV